MLGALEVASEGSVHPILALLERAELGPNCLSSLVRATVRLQEQQAASTNTSTGNGTGSSGTGSSGTGSSAATSGEGGAGSEAHSQRTQCAMALRQLLRSQIVRPLTSERRDLTAPSSEAAAQRLASVAHACGCGAEECDALLRCMLQQASDATCLLPALVRVIESGYASSASSHYPSGIRSGSHESMASRAAAHLLARATPLAPKGT